MKILLAAMAAAVCTPQRAAGSLFFAKRPSQEEIEAGWRPPRRLAVAVSSDGLEETVVSVSNEPGAPAPGVSASDYATITEALARASDHLGNARFLMSNERTLAEGREAVQMANQAFEEAKALIARSLRGGEDNSGSFLRKKKYASHNIQTAREDEERALDVTSKVVRHLAQHADLGGIDTIGFSECKGLKVKACEGKIKSYLRKNKLIHGPHKIVIQTFKKRSKDRKAGEEGSNKVVIITDTLGETVAEIPSYPAGWTWNGEEIGPWPSCMGKTPPECCLIIKNNVTTVDQEGYEIECQFYVPAIVGEDGVRYPHPVDADGDPISGVILYESEQEDGTGRVEETPYIQATFDVMNVVDFVTTTSATVTTLTTTTQ